MKDQQSRNCHPTCPLQKQLSCGRGCDNEKTFKTKASNQLRDDNKTWQDEQSWKRDWVVTSAQALRVPPNEPLNIPWPQKYHVSKRLSLFEVRRKPLNVWTAPDFVVQLILSHQRQSRVKCWVVYCMSAA